MCLLGFIISSNTKPQFASFRITMLLLLYCIIFATSLIVLRKISKTGSKTNAYSTASIYYGSVSLMCLIFSGNLNFNILWSLPCLLGTFLMGTQHYCNVISARKSKTILEVEIINYLRVFITAIFSYFLIHTTPSLQIWVGFFIIVGVIWCDYYFKKFT